MMIVMYNLMICNTPFNFIKRDQKYFMSVGCKAFMSDYFKNGASIEIRQEHLFYLKILILFDFNTKIIRK